jgi:hypothetical protein
LTLRIDLVNGAIGPGKIRLLELVGKSGSSSAAGRSADAAGARPAPAAALRPLTASAV